MNCEKGEKDGGSTVYPRPSNVASDISFPDRLCMSTRGHIFETYLKTSWKEFRKKICRKALTLSYRRKLRNNNVILTRIVGQTSYVSVTSYIIYIMSLRLHRQIGVNCIFYRRAEIRKESLESLRLAVFISTSDSLKYSFQKQEKKNYIGNTKKAVENLEKKTSLEFLN